MLSDLRKSSGLPALCELQNYKKTGYNNEKSISCLKTVARTFREHYNEAKECDYEQTKFKKTQKERRHCTYPGPDRGRGRFLFCRLQSVPYLYRVQEGNRRIQPYRTDGCYRKGSGEYRRGLRYGTGAAASF